MQRKVFRVEQMFAGGREAAAEPRHAVNEFKSLRASAEHRDSNDSTVQDLERELALVQDIIARNTRELGRLIGDGKERRMARAAGELGAAVDGMEKATDKILKSAEVVDESAERSPRRSRTTTSVALSTTSKSTWCRSTKPAISRTWPASASAT